MKAAAFAAVGFALVVLLSVFGSLASADDVIRTTARAARETASFIGLRPSRQCDARDSDESNPMGQAFRKSAIALPSSGMVTQIMGVPGISAKRPLCSRSASATGDHISRSSRPQTIRDSEAQPAL